MHYEELQMNKLMLIAVAASTLGLAACANTDSTARSDQAPYAYDRTVGASKAPATHSDTVFQSRQAK
jgi:outer membrane murein-binding lipoprotein Lpp